MAAEPILIQESIDKKNQEEKQYKEEKETKESKEKEEFQGGEHKQKFRKKHGKRKQKARIKLLNRREFIRELLIIVNPLKEQIRREIEYLINTISSLMLLEDDNRIEFIRQTLRLFNQSINYSLLLMKISKIRAETSDLISNDEDVIRQQIFRLSSIQNQDLRQPMILDIFDTIFNSLEVLFEREGPFEELIEMAQAMFTKLFTSTQDTILANFLSKFRSQFVENIKDSCNEVHRNPEMYCRIYEFKEDKEEGISRAAHIIFEAILTIQKALEKTPSIQSMMIAENEDKIKTEKVVILSVTDISPVLVLFLNPILKNEAPNPFLDSICFQKIIQQTRRRILLRSGSAATLNHRAMLQMARSHSTSSIKRFDFASENDIYPAIAQDSLNQNRDANQQVKILSIHYPETRRHFKCCPIGQPEKIAVLVDKNSFLYTINFGLGLRYTIRQLLRLYPQESQMMKPYLLIPETTFGTIGFFIGWYAILNPRRARNWITRILEGSAEGLTGFVHFLGSCILIYRERNPEATFISNKEFYSQVAIAPLIMLVIHVIWGSLSQRQKMRRFSSNTITFLDIFLKTLFYSRFFQIAASRFINPGLLLQILSFIPGLLFSLGEEFSNYRAFFRVFMRYFGASNLIFDLLKDLGVLTALGLLPDDLKNENHQLLPFLSTLRAIYWSVSFVGSLLVIGFNAMNFVKLYQGNPEFIYRCVPSLGQEDDADFSLSSTEVDTDNSFNLLLGDAIPYLDMSEFEKFQKELQQTGTEKGFSAVPGKSIMTQFVIHKKKGDASDYIRGEREQNLEGEWTEDENEEESNRCCSPFSALTRCWNRLRCRKT